MSIMGTAQVRNSAKAHRWTLRAQSLVAAAGQWNLQLLQLALPDLASAFTDHPVTIGPDGTQTVHITRPRVAVDASDPRVRALQLARDADLQRAMYASLIAAREANGTPGANPTYPTLASLWRHVAAIAPALAQSASALERTLARGIRDVTQYARTRGLDLTTRLREQLHVAAITGPAPPATAPHTPSTTGGAMGRAMLLPAAPLAAR